MKATRAAVRQTETLALLATSVDLLVTKVDGLEARIDKLIIPKAEPEKHPADLEGKGKPAP